MLEQISLIALTRRVLDDAGALLPSSVRSLDAIHLASALLIRTDLEAFVTYDLRMLEVASELGLPVASPGMTR